MERRFKRDRLTRLTLADLSSAFMILALGVSIALLAFLLELIFTSRRQRSVIPPAKVQEPKDFQPPVRDPVDFRPPSAMEIRDLEPQLEDKGSINQVITLNIISEQPDEDRNTQQQVIIQQKMTSRGHWNSDGVKSPSHFKRIQVKSRQKNGEKIKVEVIIHDNPPG